MADIACACQQWSLLSLMATGMPCKQGSAQAGTERGRSCSLGFWRCWPLRKPCGGLIWLPWKILVYQDPHHSMETHVTVTMPMLSHGKKMSHLSLQQSLIFLLHRGPW